MVGLPVLLLLEKATRFAGFYESVMTGARLSLFGFFPELFGSLFGLLRSSLFDSPLRLRGDGVDWLGWLSNRSVP